MNESTNCDKNDNMVYGIIQKKFFLSRYKKKFQHPMLIEIETKHFCWSHVESQFDMMKFLIAKLFDLSTTERNGEYA